MLVRRSKFYLFLIAIVLTVFSVLKLSTNALTIDETRFIADFFITFDEGDVKFQYILINYYFSTLYQISPYTNAIINVILTSILGSKFIDAFFDKEICTNKAYIFILFLLPANVFFATTFLRDYNVFLVSILMMILIKNNRFYWFVVCSILAVLLRTEACIFFFLAFFLSKYKYNLVRLAPVALCIFYLLILYTPLYDTIVLKTIALQNKTLGLGLFQLPFDKNYAFISSVLNWPMYFFPMFNYEAKTIFHYYLLIDSIISFVLVGMAILFFSKNRFERDRVYRFSVYMLCFAFVAAIAETHALTIIRHKIMYMPFVFYLAFSNFKYKVRL